MLPLYMQPQRVTWAGTHHPARKNKGIMEKDTCSCHMTARAEALLQRMDEARSGWCSLFRARVEAIRKDYPGEGMLDRLLNDVSSGEGTH